MPEVTVMPSSAAPLEAPIIPATVLSSDPPLVAAPPMSLPEPLQQIGAAPPLMLQCAAGIVASPSNHATMDSSNEEPLNITDNIPADLEPASGHVNGNHVSSTAAPIEQPPQQPVPVEHPNSSESPIHISQVVSL